MIVLDRSIDTVTPFCTQFSYTGQVDEYFGVEFNKIQVPYELIGDQDPEEKKQKKKKPIPVFLTPEDIIFYQIKDMTLDDARLWLSTKIRDFKDLTSALSDSKNRDLLSEAAKEKKYIKKYKQHLSLALHVQSNLQTPTNFKLFEYEQVNKMFFKLKKIIYFF